MGRPVGTVKSWRFRGRQRLRDRLVRRGLAPSAVLGAIVAADAARTAAAQEIIRNATQFLSLWTTPGEVPASVQSLVKGVTKTMIIGKLRTTAAAFLAVVLLTAGLGAAAWGVADDARTGNENAANDEPRSARAPQLGVVPPRSNDTQATWSLALREAIDIGLDNADSVRVISRTGSQTRIAPIQGAIDPERFKSETMAHVRSIEQIYWNLCQAHVQLWSAEQAIKLGKEILKHEQSRRKVGNSSDEIIADAKQRLEQFNLDLITKNSDVITTERQLRNLLGLPPADNRRIIPVTAPNETRLEPDWEQARAIMLENQPDIRRQRSLVNQTQPDAPGDVLPRRRAYLEQVIRQTTHSLARFFLELDTNYKQFTTASRLRNAAKAELESQDAYYKEGRLTVDRMLDAVSQWASLVAAEAQYKSTYNTSIVAIEEAKDTLLDYLQIAIAPGPKPNTGAANLPDLAVARTSIEPAFISQPEHAGPVTLPPAPPRAALPVPAKEPGPIAGAEGKTISFRFTIGSGSKPVEIQGSFTIRRADSVPEGQPPRN